MRKDFRESRTSRRCASAHCCTGYRLRHLHAAYFFNPLHQNQERLTLHLLTSFKPQIMPTKKTPAVHLAIDNEAAMQDPFFTDLRNAVGLACADISIVLKSVKVIDFIPLESLFKRQILRAIKAFLSRSAFEAADGSFAVGACFYKTGTGGSHVWFSRNTVPTSTDERNWERLFAVHFEDFC